jgi:hypothetical protein
MNVVAGIVRFLALLLVVRLVVRFVAAALRPAEPQPADANGPGGAVPLLRDRICNTFFPAPRAVRAIIAGEEQSFCSAECAQRARALASS